MQDTSINILSLRDRLFAIGLVCMLLVAYAITMPPDLVFEDSATFTGACATLGLAQPPGYVLQVLSCTPFAKLALAFDFSLAQGAAFASAVAASLACAILFMALRALGIAHFAAIAAAISLGLSSTFWSQAIIPEAYALNALLVALSFLAAVNIKEHQSKNWMLVLFFLFGLSLTNHWPLFVLSSPAIILFAISGDAKHKVFLNLAWPKCIGAFLLGLLPFIHLFTVSDDAYKFLFSYQPADAISYVAREIYTIDGVSLGTTDYFKSLVAASFSFVEVFGGFSFFIFSGLTFLLCQKRYRLEGLALLFGMFATTGLLQAVRPHDQFDAYSHAAFSVYSLPAYLFAVASSARFISFVIANSKRYNKLVILVITAEIIFAYLQNSKLQDRSNENIAMAYAQQVLHSLDEDAIMITSSSDSTLPIRFAAKVFNQRPQFILVRQSEYLSDNEGRPFDSDQAQQLLASEDTQVAYNFGLNLDKLGQSFVGTHFVLDKSVKAGEIKVKLDDSSRQFIYDLIKADQSVKYTVLNRPVKAISNVATKEFIDNMLVTNTTRLVLSQDQGLSTADLALLAALEETPQGAFGRLFAEVTQTSPAPSLATTVKLFNKLAPKLSKLRPKQLSEAYRIVAIAYIGAGDLDKAKELLEQALAIYPSVFNQSVIIDLLFIYRNNEDIDSYSALKNRYSVLHNLPALEEADSWCASKKAKSC